MTELPSMALSKIAIGKYILERLKQLGVSTMFGVPGDFNLAFLEIVEDDPDIAWTGNCNELNAAYAADGYARVKHDGVGALLTTYGVGELSALNGIAGSYAEMIPVVHLVGVPTRAIWKAKPIVHHTLGDGRLDVYCQAAKLFTAAQAFIEDGASAASEIDRVLRACINLRRPVYIAIPIDLFSEQISADPLATPLERTILTNDASLEAIVLDEVERLVEEAKENIIILVDVCSSRKGAKQETLDFVKATGFTVYATPMGKGIVDESYERYGGLYIGAYSRPEIKKAFESTDLVFHIGSLKTDFNTGMFTVKFPPRVIKLHSTKTLVLDKEFAIAMKPLLPKLSQRLSRFKPPSVNLAPSRALIPKEDTDSITQTWFWPRVSQFFERGDILLAETGTSVFGILDVPFPDECTFISEILFGSIGYTVGGTLGAAVAARETGGGRTILFIGDGSLQVGVQELSTMIAKGLRPIIFLLNNRGYTIERVVLAPERQYHDIPNWSWTSLLQTLGDTESPTSKSFTVKTKAELSTLIDDPAFSSAPEIQLVEVMMGMNDAPDILAAIARARPGTSKK